MKQLETVILMLAALVPFLIGWGVGFFIRCLLFTAAAIWEGYERGRAKA